ncbi:MAG: Spy/CpxP family protein refolding chaperone [Candidatus Acidiferrales bacterium]
MRFHAKAAVRSLVLLLTGALSCMPALAQQGTTSNPPAPTAQGDQAGPGPGAPGAPPPRRPGIQVWVNHGQGRGWAEWGSRGDRGHMGAEFGMSEMGMGGAGLGGLLTRAYRALNNPQIRQQLGISDEQATKFDQQLADFAKTMIHDRANLQIQQVDLQNLLAQPNPDRSALDNQLQQLSAARVQLQQAAVNFYLTLKQEIPPEQQQKIRQFLRERRPVAWQGGGARSRGWSWRGQRRGHVMGSQPPDGSGAERRNEQQQYGPDQNNQNYQNSQGEPQGGTPPTNNQ